jgi:hypothetical protein
MYTIFNASMKGVSVIKYYSQNTGPVNQDESLRFFILQVRTATLHGYESPEQVATYN